MTVPAGSGLMAAMAARMVYRWGAAAAALLSWPAFAQPVATIPDDAALEAAHALIGTISIQVHQIFDTSDPREDKWLYREANRWHYRTRDSAVRAQLLFRSGDLYSAALLRETERNMRQLQFVREPKIRPIAYHDGVVDVLVETHDVWTLEIGPSFGRAGGANSASEARARTAAANRCLRFIAWSYAPARVHSLKVCVPAAGSDRPC